jgi:hypothetical protein
MAVAYVSSIKWCAVMVRDKVHHAKLTAHAVNLSHHRSDQESPLQLFGVYLRAHVAIYIVHLHACLASQVVGVDIHNIKTINI